MTTTKLDTFTQAYVECALWSSTDNADESGGEPLDRNYSVRDVHPDTLAQMVADCEAFQREHWDRIASDLERAGHDFWLTRNQHGAGFWDGDWLETDSKVLTDAAHVYGSVDLYIGDDGMIHGS
jgi:hypothetical protein